MLADTAHIQESDLKYVNRRRKEKKLPPIAPLYNQGDVDLAMSLMQTVSYEEKHKLSEEVDFHYTDSGHILGSAAVNLSVKTKSGPKKNIFLSPYWQAK